MLPLAKTSLHYGRNATAKALSVIDVGSSVFINGVQFSPDLSQCYGVKDDPSDVMNALTAVGQCSDLVSVVTGRVGYNNSGMVDAKVNQTIALTNGKIIALSPSLISAMAQPAVSLITINPSTGRVENTQPLTGITGWGTVGINALHSAHFVDTGTSILCILTYDDNNNNLNGNNILRSNVIVINRATGLAQSTLQLLAAGSNGGVVIPYNVGSDSGIIMVQTGSTTTSVYCATSALSTTGQTNKSTGAAITTANMLQVNYCQGKAANSFYTMHVGSGTDRFFQYIQATSPAANTTASLCTANDITPLTDMGTTANTSYESTKNASYELKVVTVNGINYLICVTRMTFSGGTASIAQFGMFAYQIDATDPTKLTLAAYQKFSVAPSLGCFDPSGTIWTYAAGTVTPYIFNGTSFVAGVPITAASLTDIAFTQQGTVIGIDKVNRYAYNLTTATAYMIDCYFQEAQMQYDSGSVTAHVVVNVYDGSGARQAQTVQLLLQGGTFQAGGTSVSITTSTSGDTVVPVTITNPGIVAVTPSLM